MSKGVYAAAAVSVASLEPQEVDRDEQAAASAAVAQNEHVGAAAVTAPKRRRLRKQAPQVDPHAAVRDWSAVMRHIVAADAKDGTVNDVPVDPDGLLIPGDEPEEIKDQWEFDPFADDD